MRVLLMGPPGAGKGTQASRLAASEGIAMISTGELFRAHVRNGTDLGRQISETLDSGGYVSDQLTDSVVQERIARPDAVDGFVLDGYPRTLDQLRALDGMLDDSGHTLQAVIELVVADAEVIERLTMRREESGRSDDSPEVVRRRLAVHHDQTEPVRSEYRRRGILIPVDGLYPPSEVERHIAAAIRSAGVTVK